MTKGRTDTAICDLNDLVEKCIPYKSHTGASTSHDETLLGSEYLFCTTHGHLLNHTNLCNRVWTPALKEAGIPYPPMIQTRHSFATTPLTLGENPLWIAQIMGHRDTDMIIKVYTKFVSNTANSLDGNILSAAHEKMFGNCG